MAARTNPNNSSGEIPDTVSQAAQSKTKHGHKHGHKGGKGGGKKNTSGSFEQGLGYNTSATDSPPKEFQARRTIDPIVDEGGKQIPIKPVKPVPTKGGQIPPKPVVVKTKAGNEMQWNIDPSVDDEKQQDMLHLLTTAVGGDDEKGQQLWAFLSRTIIGDLSKFIVALVDMAAQAQKINDHHAVRATRRLISSVGNYLAQHTLSLIHISEPTRPY